MTDIINFTGTTFLPEPPKSLLQKAKKWGMNRCIVIGFDENEQMIFGGSFAESGDILMLLELAKKHLLENQLARQI